MKRGVLERQRDIDEDGVCTSNLSALSRPDADASVIILLLENGAALVLAGKIMTKEVLVYSTSLQW